MAKLLSFLLFVFVLSGCGNSRSRVEVITPNQFRGTDIQRIQTTIDAAEGTTNKVFIPPTNANGTNIWLLDSAILVPGNMTIILDNCTLQISDRSRENMFRSRNAGTGIKDPEWISNISIVGVGDVLLKGADNPRSTGDGGRALIRDPSEATHWRVSYGSDAGREGMKQTGDWRNIMILMAYLDGYKLKNLNIENAHAWAVRNERVINAEITDIRFNCPEDMVVNGRKVKVSNRDGINLRHGCKNFRINNISGNTGDGDEIITYGIDKEKTRNIVAENMINRPLQQR